MVPWRRKSRRITLFTSQNTVAITFPAKGDTEFFPHWWTGMFPCHWGRLAFWGKVVHPYLIACDDSEQKLISLLHILHQVIEADSHSLQEWELAWGNRSCDPRSAFSAFILQTFFGNPTHNEACDDPERDQYTVCTPSLTPLSTNTILYCSNLDFILGCQLQPSSPHFAFVLWTVYRHSWMTDTQVPHVHSYQITARTYTGDHVVSRLSAIVISIRITSDMPVCCYSLFFDALCMCHSSSSDAPSVVQLTIGVDS